MNRVAELEAQLAEAKQAEAQKGIAIFEENKTLIEAFVEKNFKPLRYFDFSSNRVYYHSLDVRHSVAKEMTDFCVDIDTGKLGFKMTMENRMYTQTPEKIIEADDYSTRYRFRGDDDLKADEGTKFLNGLLERIRDTTGVVGTLESILVDYTDANTYFSPSGRSKPFSSPPIYKYELILTIDPLQPRFIEMITYDIKKPEIEGEINRTKGSGISEDAANSIISILQREIERMQVAAFGPTESAAGAEPVADPVKHRAKHFQYDVLSGAGGRVRSARPRFPVAGRELI